MTTSGTFTPAEKLTILRLLIAGKTLMQAGVAIGRPQHEILAVGQQYGHPNHDAMFRGAVQLYQQLNPSPTPPSAPRTARVEVVNQLLDEAAGHPLARISRRAKQIREQLQQLQVDVDTEREATAALKKVADLEAQLAKARDELREKRGQPAKTNGGKSDPDLAKIRAWAAQNGHTVAARGQIPAAARKAYEEAHAGA